ncbi:MAG TPA: LacI family DNA-binding transcriptional regulator, partial [Clostridia bacterium]|nr:LacI family DNA-binding transcriptional regulator [Clostridia bacterium]
MKNEVTLRDLAKLAGVSVNTVSRALNDRDGVNEQTRAQILQLAQDHHYRPNIMARTMRGIQSNMIGTLVGDITDNFFVQLLAGVEEEIGHASMPILIGNTDEDVRKQRQRLDLFLSYGCKNIIITPVDADTGFIDTLREAGVSFVIADRVLEGVEGCNQVSINNRRDAFRAVEYLLQCGHRRIAILNQRRDAFANRGLPVREEYVILTRSASTAARDVRAALEGPEPPTALFIAKDTLALNAVAAVNACNLAIPENLSVF